MKEALVTRTFKTMNCSVLCANAEAATIETLSVTLPRSYADEKTLFKAITKHIPEGYTALKVLSFEEVETLYGMSESEFLANAKVLPPRKSADDAE